MMRNAATFVGLAACAGVAAAARAPVMPDPVAYLVDSPAGAEIRLRGAATGRRPESIHVVANGHRHTSFAEALGGGRLEFLAPQTPPAVLSGADDNDDDVCMCTVRSLGASCDLRSDVCSVLEESDVRIHVWYRYWTVFGLGLPARKEFRVRSCPPRAPD
jgi:hypothetical protein